MAAKRWHDKDMKRKKPNSRIGSIAIILIVRYMLLLPIIYSIGIIVYKLMQSGFDTTTYGQIGENIRIIGVSLIAMAVTFAFMRLEKHHHVHLPRALLATIMLFVVTALVIGDGFGQYERFWWWDDMLHSLSGVITGLLGFLLVYFFNARYNMNISPLFVAVFAFAFAITMGVLWEIVEFSFDVMFMSDMQRWNLPASTVLIGKDYQGSGLRDTMSDLIVAGVGALFASIIAYFSYKNERRKVLRVMRRTFPRLTKQA
jgi:hypothetical protein